MSTQESCGIEKRDALPRSAGMWTSMIASVRWAPAAHWAGSPAEILLSDPTIRVLTAFASPAAGDGTAGLVGSSAKGSPMRSMFPLRRFCKTRTPTAPPAVRGVTTPPRAPCGAVGVLVLQNRLNGNIERIGDP